MNIPSTMKALILKQGGYSSVPSTYEPASLDPFLDYGDLAVPESGDGQVLIRLRCAAVNPSDVMFLQGTYGQPRVAGEAAGFEAVGDVVRSGGGAIADRLVDKRVAFVARGSGAWAEYVLAEAAACVPLRADVRDEDGAAMIVNPLTAYAMLGIVRKSGSKAFVMTAAASQLCKLITGLAKDEGYRAISIVRRDSQIEPLRALGATHVLNSEADGFAADFAALVKSEKPVVLLDASTGPVPSNLFRRMGSGTRWIVYGRLSDEPTTILEPGQLIFQRKRIEGFWLATWLRDTPPGEKLAAFDAVQSRFASGQWATQVAARVPLAEVHARLPGLLAGPNAGKVLIVP
ncbi:MAG: zinc-binding dehydrogenase [Nitratireductor sp.]|nr:zinc-binding dehydrogenase [Nitratireductor sp.]